MLSRLTSVTTKIPPFATWLHPRSPKGSRLLRRRASAQLLVPMFVLAIICWDLPSVGNDCILSTQSTLSQGVGLANSSGSPLVRVELTLQFDVLVLSLCCGLLFSVRDGAGWRAVRHLDTKYGMHRLMMKASTSADDQRSAGA